MTSATIGTVPVALGLVAAGAVAVRLAARIGRVSR
jgi:hypothetical protein